MSEEQEEEIDREWDPETTTNRLKYILKETENAESFISLQDFCKALFLMQSKISQEKNSSDFIYQKTLYILKSLLILNPVYDLSLFQISTVFYQLRIQPDDEVQKELLKAENSDKVDPRFIKWINNSNKKNKDTGKDTPSCSSTNVTETSNSSSPDSKTRPDSTKNQTPSPPKMNLEPSTSMNPRGHTAVDGDASVSRLLKGIDKPRVQNPTTSSTETRNLEIGGGDVKITDSSASAELSAPNSPDRKRRKVNLDSSIKKRMSDPEMFEIPSTSIDNRSRRFQDPVGERNLNGFERKPRQRSNQENMELSTSKKQEHSIIQDTKTAHMDYQNPQFPLGSEICKISEDSIDESQLLNQNKVEIGDSLEAPVVPTPSESNTHTPDFEDNITDVCFQESTRIEEESTYFLPPTSQDGSELLIQNYVEIGESLEIVPTPSESNTNIPDFENDITDAFLQNEVSVDKCIDYSWDLETFLKKRSYDQIIVCGAVDLYLDMKFFHDDDERKKVHIKVILTARSDGFKYPAFIILPLKDLEPEVIQEDLESLFKIFRDTIEFTFSPDSVFNDDSVDQFLVSTIKCSRKSRLLVWDSNAAHRSEVVKQYLSDYKLDALFVPEEVADVFQPTNVYWKPDFVAKLQENFTKWGTEHKGSPSTPDVFHWIRVAWNSIPEEKIRESFVGCGLAGWPDQLTSTNIHSFQKYGSLAKEVDRMMTERWKRFTGTTKREGPCFETFLREIC